MVTIPPAFEARRSLGAAWSSWLDALPRLVTSALDEWQLAPDGDPWHGETALVLPVRDDAGTRLALKFAMTEDDNAGEIPALKAWRGLGAVRLERADPRRGLLLLERLGRRDLTGEPDDNAIETVARLYRRLHVPAPPTVPALAPLASRWLDDLEASRRTLPAPPRFVDQAIRAGRALLADAPSPVVLHGDLHQLNVLQARREPWLVIDPKGFAGDPCYELAPMLFNAWTPGPDVGGLIRDRFYALVDASELNERRCRDWVVVRSMFSIAWEVEAAGGPARLSDAQRAWITRCITVTKSMQAVEGPSGY